MRKKAFTLVEILIALIVVAVVASLSVVTFQKTINANNDRICRQNLKTLQQAIEIYTIENNALPATLSLLTDEQIRLASEKVFGKPKENRLAIFFNNLIGVKPLFADLGKFYGNDPKVRRCPADKTTTTGGSSYTLNTLFTTKDSLEDYPDTALLHDSDYYHRKDVFSGDTYQILISPDGEYGTITKKADSSIVQDGDIAITATTAITGSCSSYTASNYDTAEKAQRKCNKTGTGCIWKDGSCAVDECAQYSHTNEETCEENVSTANNINCKWKDSGICKTKRRK